MAQRMPVDGGNAQDADSPLQDILGRQGLRIIGSVIAPVAINEFSDDNCPDCLQDARLAQKCQQCV
jgi:hypothetical protein